MFSSKINVQDLSFDARKTAYTKTMSWVYELGIWAESMSQIYRDLDQQAKCIVLSILMPLV